MKLNSWCSCLRDDEALSLVKRKRSNVPFCNETVHKIMSMGEPSYWVRYHESPLGLPDGRYFTGLAGILLLI